MGGTDSGQVTSHKQPVYNSGWFPWSRNSQTCPLSFWWDLYHLIPSRLGIFSHPINLVKWNFPCVSSELRKLFWKKKNFYSLLFSGAFTLKWTNDLKLFCAFFFCSHQLVLWTQEITLPLLWGTGECSVILVVDLTFLPQD